MVILEVSIGAGIAYAVVLMVVLAVLLGVAIAFISTKFKVKEDERAAKMLTMMPGANCGGCGFPGCAGLCDAVIKGQVTKIKTCKVISADKAQEVVDYLNDAKGPDGTSLKVTL